MARLPGRPRALTIGWLTLALAGLTTTVLVGPPAQAATATVAEFTAGITASAAVRDITPGPDGNLWFTEYTGNRIGRITPTGVVTEFSAGITAGANPSGIAAGADGNLWFTENTGNRVGRITPSGVVTEFPTGAASGAHPNPITAGPDGNLWFVLQGSSQVGRVTTAGVVTLYGTGITTGSEPHDIVAGPDGNLWFTEAEGNSVGRITPSGVVTEFAVPPNYGSTDIAAGADGNLWFTTYGGPIGRITPAGGVTMFTDGLTGADPFGITAGPDGNLWFTGYVDNRIGRMSYAGVVTFPSGAIVNNSAGSTTIIPGPDGNLWISETNGSAVARLTGGQDAPAFSNPTPIAIPGVNPASPGPGSPYPSPVTVAGLQGSVTDVRVRLTGFSHTFAANVGFVLVGPAGQSVTLSYAALGGQQPVAAGTTLTLSDAATATVPMNTLHAVPVSGVFRPTGSAPSLPAPAPAAPYGTALSVFDGTAPNGVWKLYVADTASGDSGMLAGGWGLDIDTTGPPATPLALTLTAKKKQGAKKVSVLATCTAVCTFTATAKGKADGTKLKSSKPKKGAKPVTGAAGGATKLKVKFPKSTLAKIAGDPGKLTVTVTATAGGVTTTQKIKVKLK